MPSTERTESTITGLIAPTREVVLTLPQDTLFVDLIYASKAPDAWNEYRETLTPVQKRALGQAMNFVYHIPVIGLTLAERNKLADFKGGVGIGSAKLHFVREVFVDKQDK